MGLIFWAEEIRLFRFFVVIIFSGIFSWFILVLPLASYFWNKEASISPRKPILNTPLWITFLGPGHLKTKKHKDWGTICLR